MRSPLMGVLNTEPCDVNSSQFFDQYIAVSCERDFEFDTIKR